MKKVILNLAVLVSILPVSIVQGYFGAVDTFANNITGFFSSILVPLVFAVALVVFLWGMFTYFIAGGGDEGKRGQGKSLMVWAVIAFVVMVSIWGIVNFLSAGLGSGAGGFTNTITPPAVNTPAVPAPIQPKPRPKPTP